MKEVGILCRRVKELESLLNQTHHSSPTGHQNELQVESVVNDQCWMQQQGGPEANREVRFTEEVCFTGEDPTSADVEFGNDLMWRKGDSLYRSSCTAKASGLC